MNDEDAFLCAIESNPLDDTARLVYADWLDEQDNEACRDKAQFIRSLIRLKEDTRIFNNGMKSQDEAWLSIIMGSVAVTIHGYTPECKFSVIRAVKEVTGWGLVATKEAVERLPCRVWTTPVTSRDLVVSWVDTNTISPFRSSPANKVRPLMLHEARRFADTLSKIRNFAGEPGVSFTLEPKEASSCL